jgi:hypothetical protein
MQMDGATAGGPNRSLIDDPTFLSSLDDLDRGLRTVRTSNGADDEGEVPVDCSPASPPLPSQSPYSPLSRPPTGALADDPNFRASLEALDWGLDDDGTSDEPATSGSPIIVPQLVRQQPPPTAMSSASLSAPAAWSAPGPSAAKASGRPLLDLFPVGPANAIRAMTLPAAQTRAGPPRRDVSEAPMRPFTDGSEDDFDDSQDATVRDGERPDGRAQQLKGFGFVAFFLVMMLLGASIGALVFHARVSRIIVLWQSVSISAPPPTATHANPD